MSSLKARLKAARQALNDKDNGSCISQCNAILKDDPRSYNALVFLGLAYTNIKDYPAGQLNYEEAIKVDESNLLAWQGLLSLLEQSGDPIKYLDTASRVASIHAECGDAEKCLQVIEKTLDHAKREGSSTHLAQALRLILPVSPFFRPLEDRLPPAADTYVDLAHLLEEDEASRISSAIAKGRTRLGVKLDQLTKDVKNEVFADSQLEAIYEEIINWSHEEPVRRQAEQKLLTRTVDHLHVLRSSEKSPHLYRVMQLARGMTIVKVPNYLAWTIVLDWNDFYMSDLDLDLLLTFQELFPTDEAATALRTFIWSEESPISELLLLRHSKQDGSHKAAQSADANTAISALVAVQEKAGEETSLLCLRALLHCYDAVQEWSSCVETAQKCISIVKRIETSTSASLLKVTAESQCSLATAMIHHRVPRYHDQALELFDELKQSDSTRLRYSAMIGIAQILRSRGVIAEAEALLLKVLEEQPDHSQAKLDLAQCKIYQEPQNALQLLQNLGDSASVTSKRQLLATIHYLIGTCHANLKADPSVIYASYIQSLRYDANYAPAYSALGCYYADFVKDQLRAEKCFQKALELSPAEIDSGQRLAATFAEDGDWELVAIIAQRVINGNERLSAAWPFRALGFVCLNTKKYAEAVTRFQAGLRLSPRDVDAWIGLGEAYLELGRFTAAEKAFKRASLFDSKNWYAGFLNANVATALGEHEIACSTLTEMLTTEKSPGIRASLGSAYLAWTKALLEAGWISKALDTARKCLKVAVELLDETKNAFTHNLLGQAAMFISEYAIDSIADLPNLDQIQALLVKDRPEGHYLYNLDSATESAGLKGQLAYIAANAFVHCIEEEVLENQEEALLWSNVAIALQLVVRKHSGRAPYHEAAIVAMRCAVKLDPRNASYWSGLGIVLCSHDLAFSQHCLIKAATLDPKSARNWSTLGFYYLKLHHLGAANEAFLRAQTLEPASSLAWLGQACLAHDMAESSHELFEHAVKLDFALPLPLAAAKYAASVLETSKSSKPSSSNITALSAIWLLEQALAQPCSATMQQNVQYYRILLLEHLPVVHESLTQVVNDLAGDLETAYESDESEATLQRYCEVRSILARLHLRKGSWEEALETATSVLELDPVNSPKTIHSSTVVSAIATYLIGAENDVAISMVQNLHDENPEDTTILRLLVQLLSSAKVENDTSKVWDLIIQNEHQKEATLRLLFLSIISSQELPSNKAEFLQSLARDLLNGLIDCPSIEMQRRRNILEQTLEGKHALYGQTHLEPTNSIAWLALAQAQTDQACAKIFMKSALRAAKHGSNVDDLAKVCRASVEPADRAVSLHLAPHCI